MEKDEVLRTVQSPGWKILKSKWQERFDYRYEKLRKYKRDQDYYRAQGYLDAIDMILNTVDFILNEEEHDDG